MGVYATTNGYITCEDNESKITIYQKILEHKNTSQIINIASIKQLESTFIHHKLGCKIFFTIDTKKQLMPDVLSFWEEIVISTQCKQLFIKYNAGFEYPDTPFVEYMFQWSLSQIDKTHSFEANVLPSFFWKSKFENISDYLGQEQNNKHVEWLYGEFEDWLFYCETYGKPNSIY
ncbi:MAG: hypothetical protein HRU38_09800 [Saccharospirillaceae bacterium]|nr:hypothetical protein [Pseudomonadales bacterium]NRB78946.1 hypothetical protein [Saccharospirillaceae bacterium]